MLVRRYVLCCSLWPKYEIVSSYSFGQMDKENVVCTHFDGIFLHTATVRTTSVCGNMHGSHEHYAKWNKSEKTKWHVETSCLYEDIWHNLGEPHVQVSDLKKESDKVHNKHKEHKGGSLTVARWRDGEELLPGTLVTVCFMDSIQRLVYHRHFYLSFSFGENSWASCPIHTRKIQLFL